MSRRYLAIMVAAVVTTSCFSEPSRTGTGTNNGVEACDQDVESAQKVGEPCTDGDGACQATGTFVCSADGTTTRCSVEAIIPSAEICDGVDNDCDGTVDEDFQVGEECANGVGACESVSQFTCGPNGGAVCDAVPGDPGAAELCGNGIDDDCNGETDEGFDTLDEACVSGLGVCSVGGLLVCAADGVGVECDGVPTNPPEAVETLCDGLDNDCDGEVDEGCDDDGDGFCDAMMTAMSPDSDVICPNGGGDCDDDDDVVYPGAPPACDMKDNNCDGEVDNLLRVSSYSVDAGAALNDNTATSPILAAPSDTGFCIVYNGAVGVFPWRFRAHVNASTQTYDEDGGLVNGGAEPTDLLFANDNCIASIRIDDGDASHDGELERWTTDVATQVNAPVLSDSIAHLQGSWDMALSVKTNTLTITYIPTSGSEAKYVSLNSAFASTATPTIPRKSGLIGSYPVLGDNPATRDFLYLANFIDIVAQQFDVASDATEVASLRIPSSSSRDEMVLQTVNGVTLFAARRASTFFELREVLPSLAYGRTGEIDGGMSDSQEYVNRRLFAPAPAPAVALFANPVDDQLYLLTDDGSGGFSTTAVNDSAGELLAARDAGGGIYEALWMTDPGVRQTTNTATLEVVQYTCH